MSRSIPSRHRVRFLHAYPDTIREARERAAEADHRAVLANVSKLVRDQERRLRILECAVIGRPRSFDA